MQKLRMLPRSSRVRMSSGKAMMSSRAPSEMRMRLTCSCRVSTGQFRSAAMPWLKLRLKPSRQAMQVPSMAAKAAEPTNGALQSPRTSV